MTATRPSVLDIHCHPCVDFFFFLMIPPPPRFTLFPYTTLFRSGAVVLRRRAAAAAWGDRRGCDRPTPLDRKSTRLNSSHPSISYAVFCLKKKKNKIYTLIANHSSRYITALSSTT